MEFERTLLRGLVTDAAAIDAFIENLEDAGSDNIAGLAQKQLEEYNTRKGE